VSDAAVIAIVGAAGTALGGLLKYLSDQRAGIVSITRDARKDERDDDHSLITYLQNELTRVSAERDRYLTQLLEDRDVMRDAHTVITTTTPKEGAS
jgi:predicted amino acid dehydrogenase